jgi:hypothetical protein
MTFERFFTCLEHNGGMVVGRRAEMTRTIVLVLMLAIAAVGCSNGGAADARAEPVAEEVTVTTRDVELNPELAEFIADRIGELDEIPAARKTDLNTIASFVASRVGDEQPARLTFICTHNSRRSHMSQLWAQTAAHYFSVPGVETYSGGTEATAFNPRAVAAMQRAGFIVEPYTDGKNPIYEVRYVEEMEPMQAFSKVYDDSPNPSEGFAAIMTCSSADQACPIVHGAAERIAIPYDDPKAFDGTEQEAAKYDERCAQIAREMLYVFSRAAVG